MPVFFLPAEPTLMAARQGESDETWLVCPQVARQPMPAVSSVMEKCSVCQVYVWASYEALREIGRKHPRSSIRYCCSGCSPTWLGICALEEGALVTS